MLLPGEGKPEGLVRLRITQHVSGSESPTFLLPLWRPPPCSLWSMIEGPTDCRC
jgi:hypothetical protein